MNAIKYQRTVNAYRLLILGILLAFFTMGCAIFDLSYRLIELFYGVAFFVCAFNTALAGVRVKYRVKLH